MRTAMLCLAAALLLQIAGAHVGVAVEVVQVKISDLAFSPADITVKAGTTIERVNNDFVDHTATATSGDWDCHDRCRAIRPAADDQARYDQILLPRPSRYDWHGPCRKMTRRLELCLPIGPADEADPDDARNGRAAEVVPSTSFGVTGISGGHQCGGGVVTRPTAGLSGML